MNDVQAQDRKLFIRELMRTGRVFSLLFGIGLVFVFAYALRGAERPGIYMLALVAAGLVCASWVVGAQKVAATKRFHNKRFRALWDSCRDRLSRFEEVLEKMRKEQVADLQEMPRTIKRVADGLYLALRRADMIAHEIGRTETEVYQTPPTWQAPSHDSQAKELYRIADKNIAEYRMQFAGVMAGVHRAEAQSAVFITTLDSLRMKMQNYRLVGKSPELSSTEFLEAMGEAKLQLHAIDQALDELDFSQFPKMIAAVPPPPPTHLQNGT